MIFRQGSVIALALMLANTTASAEVSEIKITKQPGLLFAPMLLMENGTSWSRNTPRMPASPT